MSKLSLRNLTRARKPSLPFARIASSILPSWDISLVFVTPNEAKKLNVGLRKKTYVPNVLSYESGKRSGEVIICLAEAKRQAGEYELPYDAFVALLFIHALLHLKGTRHGTTMEKRERALLARFVPTIYGSSHRNRHRHRNAPSKGGRARGGARTRA